MSEEDYERQIKEGLTEHIEAIYDRARQRADARRQETLARMDKGYGQCVLVATGMGFLCKIANATQPVGSRR